MSNGAAGSRALVFDAKAWAPIGDVGDNTIFWKPATILRTYYNRPHHEEQLADVRFDDGKISNGHFVAAFRPLTATGGHDER